MLTVMMGWDASMAVELACALMSLAASERRPGAEVVLWDAKLD